MKPLHLQMRLTCLLLSLCVLGASVGASLPERFCQMSGQAPLTAGCGIADGAAEAADCCAGDESAPSPAPLSPKAGKLTAADCCTVSVVYFHVAPDATGPVATLDWPDLSAAGLPVASGWRGWTGGAATVTAQALRLYESDGSPPGRVVARALVLALHQLRT